jgi:DNA-binding transcriptional LysR family regulator
LCRKRGGFRPKFGQIADSVAHAFTLVVNDGVIGLMPDYFREHPAPGVAMIPIDDAQATWDFFIVWQRGRTAGPLRVLLDSLSAAAYAACVARGGQNLTPKSSEKA